MTQPRCTHLILVPMQGPPIYEPVDRTDGIMIAHYVIADMHGVEEILDTGFRYDDGTAFFRGMGWLKEAEL